MAIKQLIRRILNNYGFEIVKLKKISSDFELGNWINKLQIETILDVGSNEGQFIDTINTILPNRKIIAFEPIKSVYDQLVSNTRGLNVIAHNVGLSDINGTAEINISKNLVSSSLLNMEAFHKSAFPESAYVSKETIQLRRLDDVIDLKDISKRILLKIDVQGYENKVIAGAKNTIDASDVVIIEFSLKTLYEGQWLFHETYNYFTSNGFKFVGMADQISDITIGLPVYGDAIFIKSDLAAAIYN